MDEATHAGKPDAFGDIARAAQINVESRRQRLLDTPADQPGRMHDCLGFVLLHGRDQGGQVADITAHENGSPRAQFAINEIGPRLGIEKDDFLAARQSLARK
jgi:hypothetical protein